VIIHAPAVFMCHCPEIEVVDAHHIRQVAAHFLDWPTGDRAPQSVTLQPRFHDGWQDEESDYAEQATNAVANQSRRRIAGGGFTRSLATARRPCESNGTPRHEWRRRRA